MNIPREQHAQYGGRSIRMHPEDAPGDEGSALVLTRRPAPRAAQQSNTPARQTTERPQVRPRRPAPPTECDELDNDALYEQRAPSSTRRYASVAAPQGQTRISVKRHPVPGGR